jgi:2-haloalkanoic acid dehalogenase type II
MARLRDFDALSFDCYGTLIDWESGLWSALSPWLRIAGSEVTREQALAAFGRHESAQEAETPGLLYREILELVHSRLAREWGLPEDRARAQDFALSVATWEPFADTVSALERLRQGRQLFVLSNVDERSFAATARKLGIELDGVFTAEAIGSYKPSRRNFEYLLERVAGRGISRERLLHCAQSLFHDIVPASEMGIATCWIDRGAGARGAGATPPPARMPSATFRFGTLQQLAEACESDSGGPSS